MRTRIHRLAFVLQVIDVPVFSPTFRTFSANSLGFPTSSGDGVQGSNNKHILFHLLPKMHRILILTDFRPAGYSANLKARYRYPISGFFFIFQLIIFGYNYSLTLSTSSFVILFNKQTIIALMEWGFLFLFYRFILEYVCKSRNFQLCLLCSYFGNNCSLSRNISFFPHPFIPVIVTVLFQNFDPAPGIPEPYRINFSVILVRLIPTIPQSQRNLTHEFQLCIVGRLAEGVEKAEDEPVGLVPRPGHRVVLVLKIFSSAN